LIPANRPEEGKESNAQVFGMTRHTQRSFSMLIAPVLLAIVWTVGCGSKTTDKHNSSDSAVYSDSGASAIANAGGPDSLTIPIKTPDGKPARFAFRSGRIEMEYSGDYVGIRRLTFSDYGLYERKLDSAVPPQRVAAVVPPFQLSILRPDYYGVIDLRAGTGQRARNRVYATYVDSPESDSVAYGELALRRSNGERLPDTTLLGKYRCRVYRQSNSRYSNTIWVWGGVPIREEVRLAGGAPGSYLLEPKRVEIGINVPDSLFEFPDGITITDVDPH